jgi:hypothetical protein
MITEYMKRTLPIAVALSVSSAGWGEWVAATHAQSLDPIQSIRQQYAAINKRAPRYKKVKKELSGFSTEGGQLVAYFNGPAIVKTSATYYGEGGKTDEEYYYQNGKLIFVYRRASIYDKPLSGRVVKTKDNRFYFQNDRLIKWINENGKEVSPGPEYQKQQDEYLATSNKFLNAARSKDPTIEAWDMHPLPWSSALRFAGAISWNRTLWR